MTTILHVTECYAGGVSRAIETAVHLMPDHTHHLLWEGDEPPTDTSMYTSVERLPAGLGSRIRRTKAAIAALRPDVVHAHSSWAGVYTRTLAVDAPVVYQPHCYKFDDPDVSTPLRTFYRVAEKLLAKRTAATVVLSPHEDELTKSLSSGIRRVYLPNVQTVDPAPEALLDRAGVPNRVVMIGRLSRQKDPDYFLRVAELTRARVPGVTFTWIGDGDAEPRRRLSDAGVEVTGWLAKAEIADILSGPVVYFHSAGYEGFPLSVLDAAAFNVPIVVRSIPAFDGTPLQRAESPEAASRRLIGLVTGEESTDELRRASAELLETMNVERQSAALSALYTSTAEGVTR